jgi:molecular chaperone DnaK
MAVQRIREAAEKAKIEPLSTTQTEINFPLITADAIGPKLINTKLMRSQFESVVNPLSYPMNHRPMQKLSVMLVSRWPDPQVDETVKSIFGREPSKGVNPMRPLLHFSLNYFLITLLYLSLLSHL